MNSSLYFFQKFKTFPELVFEVLHLLIRPKSETSSELIRCLKELIEQDFTKQLQDTQILDSIIDQFDQFKDQENQERNDIITVIGLYAQNNIGLNDMDTEVSIIQTYLLSI